jgi:hypothetical protein
MKIKVEFRWPSKDILPPAKREVASASEALRSCAKALRSGCMIRSIVLEKDDGSACSLSERQLVNLARTEGCGIRYPPRRRRKGRGLKSMAFAILCAALPNSWGDFATLLHFNLNRVAIRLSAGHRPPRLASGGPRGGNPKGRRKIAPPRGTPAANSARSV